MSGIPEDMLRAGTAAMWGSPERDARKIARLVLSAALAGRTVVELPDLDSCDSVDGGERFTVAALVRPDGTPRVHFDADDDSEPGACISWHADQAELLGLALVATARRARRLAAASTPPNVCTEGVTCPAGKHTLACLGLYRTEDEVRRDIYPDMGELERRRDNEQQLRRVAQADQARYPKET